MLQLLSSDMLTSLKTELLFDIIESVSIIVKAVKKSSKEIDECVIFRNIFEITVGLLNKCVTVLLTG